MDQLAAESAEKKRPVAKRGGGLTSFTDKGKKGGTEEEEKPHRKRISGMASVRADRSNKRRRDGDLSRSYGRDNHNRTTQTLRHKGTNTAAPRKEPVRIELPCTVRSFSEAASIPVNSVLKSVDGHGHHGQHQRGIGIRDSRIDRGRAWTWS